MDTTKLQTITVNEQTINAANVHSTQSEKARLEQLEANKDKLLAYVRDNIVGSTDGTLLKTVYGDKPQIYCDYTASGKSLHFIEDYIRTNIMPLYANSHSMQSASGKQTIYAREESRAIIKRACNANENDALIFIGTGATSAVNLLVNKLRIKEKCRAFQQREQELELASNLAKQVLATSDDANAVAKFEELLSKFDKKSLLKEEELESMHFCKRNRWNSFDCTLCKVILPSIGLYEKHAKSALHIRAVACEITRKQTDAKMTHLPVIFVSAYEHNSNLLPWRETGARVVVIPITANGDFDYQALEDQL